jgi:hypothetical protein
VTETTVAPTPTDVVEMIDAALSRIHAVPQQTVVVKVDISAVKEGVSVLSPVSHDSAREMLTLASLGCPDGTTCGGNGQCKIGTSTKATPAPTATLKCQQPRSAAELEIARRDFAELEKRSGEEYWFRFEDPNVVNAGNDILPGPFRPHSKVRFLIHLKSASCKGTLLYLGLRRPSV